MFYLGSLEFENFYLYAIKKMYTSLHTGGLGF